MRPASINRYLFTLEPGSRARAYWLVLLAAATVALAVGAPTLPSAPIDRASSVRLARVPPTVLWAWERSEDLRFVDPARVGVAFLARTIALDGDDVRVRPRLQPLLVPDGTSLIAVVRVESSASVRANLSAGQRARLATAIVEAARLAGVVALQIDYDAKRSERDFYAELLADVRRLLPVETPLIMTALASWCIGDAWLGGLPVDDAVPMLFRMGADDRAVRSYLASGRDFASPVCRASVGLATDEPMPAIPSGRRLYLFHRAPWTRDALDAVLRRIETMEER